MRIVPAAALLLILGSCVGPAPRPPAPAPATVVPVPTGPVLNLPAADWRDWPLTPGDWRYQPAVSGRSGASFGAAVTRFAITCDAPARIVTLSVAGGAAGQPLTIRTTSATRTVPTTAVTPATQAVALAATDPLLDAIGFSRGRFVVEQAGAPTLVLPAWAEIERVTEDCRG